MFNSEPFIGQAIESVLCQSYTNWELLIIDDGSTDDSVRTAQSYADNDSRIKVYTNPHHIGMPSAPRNYGVERALGTFIAFLDSDDIWFKDKLKQQIPLFNDDKTAIVYSNYEKMNEKGVRNKRIISAPSYITYKDLLKGNSIGNLTGIYDTRKVGKIKVLNIYHEDYAMWLDILKQGFVAKNTNTVTAAYRLSTHSLTAKKVKVLRWQWDIYKKKEHLSTWKSSIYYIHYAIRACKKKLI